MNARADACAGWLLAIAGVVATAFWMRALRRVLFPAFGRMRLSP